MEEKEGGRKREEKEEGGSEAEVGEWKAQMKGIYHVGSGADRSDM